MRFCVSPVEGRPSGGSRSMYPSVRGTSPARRSSASSARTRSTPLTSCAADARQLRLARDRLAPVLAVDRQPFEPRDLRLAEGPRGMVLGEAVDQVRDAVADLEREVRRGRAHQLPHVLDGRLALQAVGTLVLAHGLLSSTGIRVETSSMRACCSTEIVSSS